MRSTRGSEAALKREWLMPEKAHMRYKGLRGVYWYWLSRDVRKSEWEKWGVCLTCLEPIDAWEEGDCGHILAARWCGEYLRFHRKNLTIQHKGCNNPRFSPEAGVMNAVNIDKRYGEGYLAELLRMQKIVAKEPKQSEYRSMIRGLSSYQERLAEVSRLSNSPELSVFPSRFSLHQTDTSSPSFR